jgi:hypothetical protein
MKKLITAISLLAIFCGLIKAGENKNPLMASSTVVWAGLDYSMMHIVGNTNEIRVPELIFQDMPQKWNELFLDERIEGVASSLHKRVFIDIQAVTERNKMLMTNQDIFEPDSEDAINKSTISAKDISNTVQSLKMNHANGLGLMFIIDRFVYHVRRDQRAGNASAGPINENIYTAAVYVVFFDIATRQLISVKRETSTVGTGGSYRFFWFGPIKNIDSDLVKYR